MSVSSKIWHASLQKRLLVGTLAWILTSILVVGWGLHSLFSRHVESQFRSELTIHLDQLVGNLTIDSSGHPALTMPLTDPRLSTPFSGLYWQIDSLGDTHTAAQMGVLRSRSLWDHVLALPADPSIDGGIHQFLLRGPDGRRVFGIERKVLPAEDPAQSLRLIVAADQDLMNEPINRFTRLMYLALGVLALGLILAAVVQVFIGLRPLSQLRLRLAALRDGQAPNIEGSFPSEIQPLVDDFNSVLRLNAQVIERARTQAGNLAHAVKTPLTILANRASTEDSPLATLVNEQVALARRQVDYHLARARVAAAGTASMMRLPLRPLIIGLVRVMERLYAERGLTIALMSVDDRIMLRGEEQDFQEMFGNILDNACKWAKSRVEISMRLEGRMVMLMVDDDGEGLIESEYATIFERGARADEHVPGSGLGLAIVHDLAQLYGGGVYATKSPAGGLRVVLKLPGGL
ncbi:ATP-binding protein [Alcaligenaceae bacterium CGII-47]|nr:ATP-binding protein [Alcaligenaceae bacterium CGII-47]